MITGLGHVAIAANSQHHGVRPAAAGGGGGFEAALGELAASVSDALGAAEQTSLAAMSGRATTRDVVDAVMRAEQTLQTAIALRDKTVGAIQEITRMSI